MKPEMKKLNIGSKKTVGLRITEEQYQNISHLFDDSGRPISKELDYYHNIYKWTLWRGKPIIESGGNNLGYNLYGVCGDSTFGNIPWYFKLQYAGNIRAAKEIYNKFIEKHFNKE